MRSWRWGEEGVESLRIREPLDPVGDAPFKTLDLQQSTRVGDIGGFGGPGGNRPETGDDQTKDAIRVLIVRVHRPVGEYFCEGLRFVLFKRGWTPWQSEQTQRALP